MTYMTMSKRCEMILKSFFCWQKNNLISKAIFDYESYLFCHGDLFCLSIAIYQCIVYHWTIVLVGVCCRICYVGCDLLCIKLYEQSGQGPASNCKGSNLGFLLILPWNTYECLYRFDLLLQVCSGHLYVCGLCCRQ